MALQLTAAELMLIQVLLDQIMAAFAALNAMGVMTDEEVKTERIRQEEWKKILMEQAQTP